MNTVPSLILFAVLLTITIPHAQANLSCQERVGVGVALSEIRGHIWAVEANVDRTLEPSFEHDRARHVPSHAFHPLGEVYPEITDTLSKTDSQSVESLRESLEELQKQAQNPQETNDLLNSVYRAQAALNNVQNAIFGSDSADDLLLDIAIISSLITESTEEYDEAIEDNKLLFVVELQDAYAFHKIAHNQFRDISSERDSVEFKEIDNLFLEFYAVYDNRDDPAKSTALGASLVEKLKTAYGISDHLTDEMIESSGFANEYGCNYFEDNGHDDGEFRILSDAEKQVALEHVASIRTLLLDAKNAYATDHNLALELVKEAYIDHFEFIEDDLEDSGYHELNEKVEHEIRDELTSAIRAQSPDVPQMIDDTLVNLNMVEQVVPEFGALTLVVLVITIAAIVGFTSRSQLFTALR